MHPSRSIFSKINHYAQKLDEDQLLSLKATSAREQRCLHVTPAWAPLQTAELQARNMIAGTKLTPFCYPCPTQLRCFSFFFFFPITLNFLTGEQSSAFSYSSEHGELPRARAAPGHSWSPAVPTLPEAPHVRATGSQERTKNEKGRNRVRCYCLCFLQLLTWHQPIPCNRL